MSRYFSFHEIFPIIEKVIADYSHRSKDFMTHGDIVNAMLADREGCRLITRLPAKRTPSGWAGNMVAWFGQAITVKWPGLHNRFDREKIGGRWAYRLHPQDLDAVS